MTSGLTPLRSMSRSMPTASRQSPPSVRLDDEDAFRGETSMVLLEKKNQVLTDEHSPNTRDSIILACGSTPGQWNVWNCLENDLPFFEFVAVKNPDSYHLRHGKSLPGLRSLSTLQILTQQFNHVEPQNRRSLGKQRKARCFSPDGSFWVSASSHCTLGSMLMIL